MHKTCCRTYNFALSNKTKNQFDNKKFSNKILFKKEKV